MIVANQDTTLLWSSPNKVISSALRTETNSNVIRDDRFLENAATLATQIELSKLFQLTDNWDGYDSKAPSISTIEKSRDLLIKLHKNFTQHGLFRNPFVSVSENGEVVFEWWDKDRKLTFYIDNTEYQFLKSWGPNIFNDMEDGELSDSNLIETWLWLVKKI